MSRKWKTLILIGASLVVVCAASAILISRASTQRALITKGSAQSRTIPRNRNLRLQPEAGTVNRRLGNRFKLSGRAESTLSGTITVAGNQQPVTMIRRQTEDGEVVEVLVPGRRLTWTSADGIIATPVVATESERLLVERLIFDSADQFVLAQLRGASYYTVMRNVRPDDAGENYSGPLWRLVRISEPQGVDDTTPKNRWRLYYINEATELIDCIVSERDGEMIEARIQWTERNDEQIPSNIEWTKGRQKIMQFEITAFSQNN